MTHQTTPRDHPLSQRTVSFGERHVIQDWELGYFGNQVLAELSATEPLPWHQRLRDLLSGPQEVTRSVADEWLWIGFRVALGGLPAAKCTDVPGYPPAEGDQPAPVPSAECRGFLLSRSDDHQWGYIRAGDLALRFALGALRSIELNVIHPAREAGGYSFGVQVYRDETGLSANDFRNAAHLCVPFAYSPVATLDLLMAAMQIASFFGVRLKYQEVMDV